MRIEPEKMSVLGLDMLEAAGIPRMESEIMMEILIDTSLRGIDSHGVRALPRYIRERREGGFRSGDEIKVLRDYPVTAMWDATNVNGFVVGTKAMEAAMERAEKYKMGSVGCLGPAHNGALYWYTLLATRKDMVGVVLQRGARQVVAPYGGVEGRLGTNPFAIGIPSEEGEPILLDMATNAVATGHFLTMKMRGERIPEGWLIDKDGNWVEEYDADASRRGEMAPVSFGGKTSEYKGYGIKVVLEALAGGIASGCSLDASTRYDLIYMAIDPTGFCDIDDFKERVDSMRRHLKSSEKRPGFKEIYLPGELESLEKEKRLEEGILIDDEFWEEIEMTTRELDVKIEDYV
jgi:LDH2 family malate/lactate/ureidoglycolate dehydrogenase